MRINYLITAALSLGLATGSPLIPAIAPFSPATDNSTLGALDKRYDCTGNPVYCPAFGVYCNAGTACCSPHACCPAGYACYTDGNCHLDVVYTYCSTALVAYTSTLFSTVYNTVTSTWFTTTTDYTTVTETRQTGVATNTQWVTITTVVKRDFPVETGSVDMTRVAPIPAPTSGPRYEMVGDGPELLFRRTLESWGVVGKRTLYTTITVIASTTLYRYSYYTSYYTYWVTSKKGVLLTSTAVVFNGASSTVLVTSTFTVTSQSPPPQPPPTTPTQPATQPTQATTTQPTTQPTVQPTTELTSPSQTQGTPTDTQQTAAPTPTTQPTQQSQESQNQTPDTPSSSEPPASTTLTLAPTFVPTGSDTSIPTLVAKTSTSSGVAFVFYTTPPDASSAGLSAGATAGVGIGAAVGAVLLFSGLGFLIWRWRRNRDPDEISRAGGTATPATGSDFYPPGGAMSRTPVSYAGFAGGDKIVSPHTSMAGSPPPVTHAYPPPAHISEAPAEGGFYAPAATRAPPAAAGAVRHQSWASSSGYGGPTVGRSAASSPPFDGGGFAVQEAEGFPVHEAPGGYAAAERHYREMSGELAAERGYGYGDGDGGGHGYDGGYGPQQHQQQGYVQEHGYAPGQEQGYQEQQGYGQQPQVHNRHLSGEMPGDVPQGPARWHQGH